ncbi:osmotically inducible protein OsmC [Amycolatopsis antarctica]|uniref:Osmotically inducible protein OsmC n=1 Tax=Amycolatopsis antarctica TaxID=1854586 RepID=A0A263D1P1_9PSEU|nr:OsmC family protein [Amycolatopsis antarctica]OZM71436.1 osmotically inducible protein OsmC [Amycolatopsis antarctica]
MSLTDVIEGTRTAVDNDPRKAAASFTTHATLVPHTRTRVDVRVRDHKVTVDEPAALGGEDTAANPVEYALASLGSCQVITYQFWAARLGIPLDAVEVTVEGDLDLRGFLGFSFSARPGFSGISVRVELSGPADAEQYAELRRQVDEHCPVLDLFRNETPVRTGFAT